MHYIDHNKFLFCIWIIESEIYMFNEKKKKVN